MSCLELHPALDDINDLITDLANITCFEITEIDMIARCFGMFGVYHLESICFFSNLPKLSRLFLFWLEIFVTLESICPY